MYFVSHIPRILLCLFCFFVFYAKSQDKTKYFQLSAVQKKNLKSLYSKVHFLDSREDTSNFGVVRVGALNKEALVVAPISLGEQLSQLLFEHNPENAGKGELLFQLRKLKFIEKADGLKEFGYCFFRANLYTPVENGYRQLAAIDTFLEVGARDVTRLIMEKANKTICSFFLFNLKRDTSNTKHYTYTDILNLDEVEKKNMKLYNVNEYTDGIYTSFKHFRDQTPDYTLYSITFEDGEISQIKARNQSGKVIKINSEHVYAIVNKGKPYISAEFGYYPLVKNNNDFYFVADDRQHYIKGHVVKGGSILKPTEFVYSTIPLTSLYEIKIDHLNGMFMRVKEIKETSSE